MRREKYSIWNIEHRVTKSFHTRSKAKSYSLQLEPKFDAPIDYRHSLQLACDKIEIESLNKFFEIIETYYIYQSRSGFYLLFSMNERYIKLKNNDVLFKSRKFPNIDNEMEIILELEDIIRGAFISIIYSLYFYEYSRRNKNNKDKSKSSNIEERKNKKIREVSFELNSYSLRIDHITLIK